MIKNKINPAIIIVAYNRPKSLVRLLKSIKNACYQTQNIPLIFSIDFQNSIQNDEVASIAENFIWEYGTKRIIKHKTNLGLKNHILSCGDLTKVYNSVIVLEDDLIVSPSYYCFAKEAEKFYINSKSIGGISLYSYEYEELGWFRFYPKKTGADNFFMQWASSWGQLWTKKQWVSFRNWYSLEKDLDKINVPNKVKKWQNSWKKYFIAYLVDTEKYFVYPYNSFTTLMDGGGIHYNTNSRHNPVNLIDKSCNLSYEFTKLENNEIKYDVFFQPKKRNIFIESLNKEVEIEFDFYSSKEPHNFEAEYVMSVKKSKNPIVKFSFELIPYEDNLINNNRGDFFTLALKNDFNNRVDLFTKGIFLLNLRKILSMRQMLHVLIVRIIAKMFKP